ncbi:hypothetical protein [Bradyrhizobium japonicum]|uniref:hypothetical protein n=1 Tax=Bradyrhizobium japonicum TaxID=375 RepID=UPI00200ED35B|nr:hypothetical protein [Bradyrhizobium japonicum]UQD96058.1 hypothetical protein JEY30_31445 [Bradyrhizobium japonicum]
MSALKVFNIITKETAAMMHPNERHLADKLVETLRRNGKATGEHGAFGWTVVEVSNDNMRAAAPDNDNKET